MDLPWTRVSTSFKTNRSVAFKVDCQCQNPDHEIDIWVEANDDDDITLELYGTISTYEVTQHYTNRSWPVRLWFQLVNRIKMTRDIWITGEVKAGSTVMLNQDGAESLIQALRGGIAHASERKVL